jgi:hypothetical protein
MSTEVLPGAERLPASTLKLIRGPLLALAAVLLLACTLSVSTPSAEVVWGSCALTAWCAALLYICGTLSGCIGTGLAQWKLGAWMLAWCAVTFGLATAAWSPLQPNSGAQLTSDGILRGLWLVAVAMTAWAIGYCGGPRRLAERHAGQLLEALGARFTPTVRSPAAPWILYVAGTAARVATVATTGRLGYIGNAEAAISSASGYQQALTLAGELAPLGIAAAALRAYGERAAGSRLTLAVLCAAEITYGALAGGKSPFVIALLAVVIPYTALRRRIPLGLVAVGVTVFLIVIIPFTGAYRSAVHPENVSLTPREGISAAPAAFRQSGALSAAVLPQAFAYLAQRVQEIDGPAIIMQRTPAQIPYTSPAQLPEDLIADLIPRAVWPGKPIPDDGNQFSEAYYGSTGITYSAISPAGDLYRHGGWPVVVAGMLVLGVVVRVLDDVLDVRNPHGLLMVLLLFPVFVTAEDDWVSTLNGLPALTLTWLVAVALTFGRRGRGLSPRRGHEA